MKTNIAMDRHGILGIRESSMKLVQYHIGSPTFVAVFSNSMLLLQFESQASRVMKELQIFHSISPFCEFTIEVIYFIIQMMFQLKLKRDKRRVGLLDATIKSIKYFNRRYTIENKRQLSKSRPMQLIC